MIRGLALMASTPFTIGVSHLKVERLDIQIKKKNTYTVPHSNNVIDFSALYGFQTYEQREIKYVLNVADINFNDPNTVNAYEMRLTNWLMQGVGQMWLVDDVFPTFHFLAEVVNGTSFKQIGANGELTISFTAYSFKIEIGRASCRERV